jgi:hypothetical protein
MGGKSKKVTVGYKYYMGAHFALCHGPADALTHIWVAERLAWSGSSAGGNISINKPELFGGEKREGGITGNADVAMGGPTQGANSYLSGRLGAAIPAFRGVVSLILKQMYIGNNPYLKPWKMRLRRILKSSGGADQWYPSKAVINTHDMNPAHIIRECLTDPDWGSGYTSNDIDDSSFTAAADKLYSEGFGLSFLWEQEQPIEDFVRDVLRHIDAALYVHPSTGRFTLKLVRDDYTIGSLPVLGEDYIRSVEEFDGQLAGEVTNAVTVRFWDRATGKTASLGVQDIALLQESGSPVSASIEFAGCPTPTLAARLASRELRTLSSSAARGAIVTRRLPAELNVGHAFVMNWPKLGISGKVMRIVSIEHGDHLNGSLRLNIVEDVFSLSQTSYLTPAPSEWVDPISEPVPVAFRKIIEMPYRELVSVQGQTTIDANLSSDAGLGYMAAFGPNPTSDAFGAKIYVDSGGGYQEDGFMAFCPNGILSGPMLPTDTVFELSSSENLDEVEAGEFLQIDDEMMVVQSLSGTTVTVRRGIFDTVPAPHASGSTVLFWDNAYGSDEREYAEGETIAVKLATSTGKGVLPIDSAPADALTLQGRAARPYPPGDWKICGAYFPTTISYVPLETTWRHRDRTQQTGADHIGFLAASIGPEAGVTYRVTLLDLASGTTLHVQSGLTGTSYSGFPALAGERQLRMRVAAERGGLASLYSQSHDFTYIGTAIGDTHWASVSALLHFDGANNSTAFTEQKGNTVTVFGAARMSTAVRKFGTASGYFDGDGDYLTLPSAAGGSITGDFTIEAWIRPSTVSVMKYIARKGEGAYTSGYAFGVASDGKPYFTPIGPADEAGNVVKSSTPIPANQWTHVAATKSGTTVRIFVNGELTGTSTLVASVSNNTSPLYVGRDPATPARDWSGYIDEFRVTPGVCRYTATFAVPTSPFGDGLP